MALDKETDRIRDIKLYVPNIISALEDGLDELCGLCSF